MTGKISDGTIQRVCEIADIVGVINEYTNLAKRGNQYWGLCPFHNEKTPSFSVDPVRKFYYCFGCGAGGNVIKFVMETEKLSYPQAIIELAARNNVEVIYEGGGVTEKKVDYDLDGIREVYDRLALTFHYFLTQSEMGSMALEYVKGRALSFQTIEKFKLGYAPPDRFWLKKFLRKKNYSEEFLAKTGLFSQKYPDISLFSGRLMFPIFDRKGAAVAFGGRIMNDGDEPKYLNSPELLHYKKRETLYAFNFAKKAIQQKKAAILCEGYMDVIAYHQCGIENAVAPLGTALTEQQLKILRGFADIIFLSFDSDGAGQKATARAILMCRKSGFLVKIIQLSGAKDPAEILKKFGAEHLTKFVENAIMDSDYLLSKLKGAYPSLSPDDKTRAAFEFFSYVDSLDSDIQKESCLEQFAQSFDLALEVVKKDFNNRDQAKKRLSQNLEPVSNGHFRTKFSAELRTVLAVTSNLDEYRKMRESLTSDDFEESLAKELFLILEECYKEGVLSLASVLDKCKNEEIQNLVAAASVSNEFHGDTAKYIMESVRTIKRKSLKRKAQKLSLRINNFIPVTADDEALLKELVSVKMQINEELKRN